MKHSLIFALCLSLVACVNPPATKITEQAKKPSASASPDLMYRILVADLAARRGDLKLAKKEYIALAHKTRNSQIVEKATRVAIIDKDYETALKLANLWVNVDAEEMEARKMLVALLVKLGRTEEATPHLEKIVSFKGNGDLEGFIMAARLLSGEKDAQKAYAVMKSLVAKKPKVAEAQFALAELANRAGFKKEAIVAIDKALAEKPEWKEAIIFKTRVLKSLGKVDDAIQFLENKVAILKGELDLRLNLARLLLDAKRYAQARTQFAKLLELAPENSDIIYALGGLSLEIKKYADAERYLMKLIKMGAKTNIASYYLGQTFEEQKRYKEAIKWYSKVDEGDQFFHAQIRIAMIYTEQDKLKSALQQLDTINSYSKDQKVRVMVAKGEAYRHFKKYKEENDIYTQGLKQFPENVSLLYSRALAAEKIGNLKQVEEDLKIILKKEPDNSAALNALGYTLADRTQRYEEAYGYIKRALEIRPDDAAILDSMGWVLYRMGKLKESVEYLRKAMKVNPDPEIAAHLGEVLWKIGNQQAAKEIWNKAKKTSPKNEVLQGVMEKFKQL